MLISFFSLFLSYNLISLKKNINFFQEDFYLLIYLITLILFFFIFFNNDNNFSSTFLALTSSISNIGFSVKSNYDNMIFLFLILTIIGGAFFSTSSGLRLTRLYVLFKFSINELIHNAKPKNIYLTKLYLSDSKYETSDLNKFFLSFITFFISLTILCSLLTFFDINFEQSFKLSILTLMNTTNSYIHNLNDFNFEELHYFAKYTFILFMIIGRVELLTVLIILKKFFFKS
jgi:trk system potassium uptake protein TrkH